jgi:hypothetical protein
VNAVLVVDPEYDAKAAKGLERRQLRNGSIGLSMSCVPSHPDMSEDDFYCKQGEMVNGNQVRWIPEEMYAVRHMAMLAAFTGADPDAGRREASADNSANSQEIPREEINKMEKLTELLRSVLEKLNIDAIVTDAMPEGLDKKVLDKVSLFQGAEQRYNELAESVQAIGKLIKVNKDEADLSAAQTLERLPDILVLAEQGKRLVEFKVAEAVEWFSKSKFDPKKTELSEVDKRMVERIQKLTDLDHLSDLITEYKELAEAKFPANDRRVSGNPELPNDKGNFAYSGGNRDIVESSSRLFPKPKKEDK